MSIKRKYSCHDYRGLVTMYKHPNVVINVHYNRALTLREFKDVCPPMALWNIGRKISSICRFPDHISHGDAYQISREVAVPLQYTQFAIDLLLLGMSDVLGLHREISSYGLSNFNCFCDPASRIELGSYFASQMIDFRNELRYRFQYVDILLNAALKSPFTRKVITDFNGFENCKDIMLFCGLSVHTLLMACNPLTITGNKQEQKKIYIAQLEWRMRHNEADESLYLRRGYDTPTAEGRDVWDRSGEDCMENISQLQLALAAAGKCRQSISNTAGLLFE